MKRALSVLRGALFLLVSSLASSSSAQVVMPMVKYFAGLMAQDLTDAESMRLMNAVYNGNGGGDIQSVPFTVSGRQVYLNMPLPENTSILEPYIGMKCKSAPVPESLCASWTNYSEKFRKTVSDVVSLPALTPGLDSYGSIGTCALNDQILGNGSSTVPYTVDFKLYAVTGKGYAEDLYKDGLVVKGSGVNGGSATKSFHNFYATKCLNMPTFPNWVAVVGVPETSVGPHVRYALRTWVNMQQTPVQVLSLFRPGLGYDFPDDMSCTEALCPGYAEPSGPPPPPACTRPDGSTSGNPYDCSPDSADTGCKIIDIYCAVKKAFIPSNDFMKNGFEAYAADALKLPARRVEQITIDSNNQMIGKITLDFTVISGENPVAENMLRLISWYQVFFWSLAFIGFPSPFKAAPNASSSAGEVYRAAGKNNGD